VHLRKHAGHAPKKLGAICDPAAFVVENTARLYWAAPWRLVVDLIEPGVRAKSMLGLALIDALFNPQQGRQPRDLSGYAPGLVL